MLTQHHNPASVLTATATGTTTATTTATATATTVRDLIAQTALPRLETQMLLSHVLAQPRVWLVAHDDACLSQAQLDQFADLRDRRLQGEPMAYLVGHREFMGLDLAVGPDVLIPRPETEFLVEAALEAIADITSPRVLDLGTGSGAIAIAIAKARPDAEVVATDISLAALELAQSNAKRHGVSITWLHGAWFEALSLGEHQVGQSAQAHQAGQVAQVHKADQPDQSAQANQVAQTTQTIYPPFDAIVSNPPYIHVGDQHLTQGDVRFEPQVALTDGADGLSAYRTICAQAGGFVRKGGAVLFEHGFDQALAVTEIMRGAGFVGIKTIQDLAGHPRVTAGFYNP